MQKLAFFVHCSVSECLANQQATVLELSHSVAVFEQNRTQATRILPTILSEFYSEFCSVSKVVVDHDDLQTHWRYMLCKLVNSEQIFLIQTTSKCEFEQLLSQQKLGTFLENKVL